MNVEVPQERAAVPVSADESSKPIPVPELIMSEASIKKDAMMDKPEEPPIKSDLKPEIPESSESNEKEEKPSL